MMMVQLSVNRVNAITRIFGSRFTKYSEYGHPAFKVFFNFKGYLQMASRAKTENRKTYKNGRDSKLLFPPTME